MLPFHVVDGPADAPVVLLSGSLGSTLDMWRPQVARLSQNLRVVRLDHRGHGGSPVPPGPYTVDDLGSDALELGRVPPQDLEQLALVVRVALRKPNVTDSLRPDPASA